LINERSADGWAEIESATGVNVGGTFYFCCRLLDYRLDVIASELPARIGNREDPNMLVAGTDIPETNTKLF
jgi:hypothetical protein